MLRGICAKNGQASVFGEDRNYAISLMFLGMPGCKMDVAEKNA